MPFPGKPGEEKCRV